MGQANESLSELEHATRVLHVEDDPALAEMYALGLQIQGFQVLRAADGLTGVKLAATEGLDFLVVDIGLPGWDGLEVVRRVRADPRTASLPIVFLTAFNPEKYCDRAAQLGVEDVLLNSVTPPKMLGEAIRRRLPKVRPRP